MTLATPPQDSHQPGMQSRTNSATLLHPNAVARLAGAPGANALPPSSPLFDPADRGARPSPLPGSCPTTQGDMCVAGILSWRVAGVLHEVPGLPQSAATGAALGMAMALGTDRSVLVRAQGHAVPAFRWTPFRPDPNRRQSSSSPSRR